MEILKKQFRISWQHGRKNTTPDHVVNTGPKLNLPPEARSLDYSFLFLPQSFFEIVVEESSRYAQQVISANGKQDPIWWPTDASEI